MAGGWHEGEKDVAFGAQKYRLLPEPIRFCQGSHGRVVSCMHVWVKRTEGGRGAVKQKQTNETPPPNQEPESRRGVTPPSLFLQGFPSTLSAPLIPLSSTSDHNGTHTSGPSQLFRWWRRSGRWGPVRRSPKGSSSPEWAKSSAQRVSEGKE